MGSGLVMSANDSGALMYSATENILSIESTVRSTFASVLWLVVAR
jgi:hypothetical protein